MKQEWILCAAIHFDDGEYHDCQPSGISTGIVLCGHRHFNVFAQTGLSVVQRKQIGWVEKQQGFLTSRNRFVSREEAALIAQAAGQLKAPLHSVKRLFSEDLY